MSMDVISAIAPGSDLLDSNFMSGFNPVSRNGEQTRNAFINAFEYNEVGEKSSHNDWRWSSTRPPASAPDQLALWDNAEAMSAPSRIQMTDLDQSVPFNEWASVVPGIICVSRRDRNVTYRNSVAAETAMPVIACAQKFCTSDNVDYRFAGIARSPSVRPYDDGRGPTMDEYFTLAIGGAVTMLNNGNNSIGIGDLVEWTFYDDTTVAVRPAQRKKMGPRTIVLRTATTTSARTFGRALSAASRGDWIDILITT
jgi:hypothetical protein